MQITVQLTSEAAACVRGADARGVRALAWLEHPLHPVHPATRDACLATFFTIDVEDREHASRLVERLLKDPAVEAAYVKPGDEPA